MGGDAEKLGRRTLNKNYSLDFGKTNEKQRLFYLSRTLYTAYGGARGGGKSHAVRVKAAGGALTYSGIRILILRRTYPELQNSLIDKLLKLVPRELASYNGGVHTLSFVNGSVIKFGNYGPNSDTEYQGQEYDWIFIDEATQFTYDEFRTLGGCLRGASRIPKRFYLTCNPGGVGHSWVKRLFIDRNFYTDPQDPERDENPLDYSFIFATVEDNAAVLKGSPHYMQMLSSLPESIRRAHRYGDWDALSGQFFSEFRWETHTVEPFKIPGGWTRYRAFDYGLDMFACLWVAVDCRGRSYVYREARVKGLIVSDAAKLMRDMTLPNEKIACTIAPFDMWSTQRDTGLTIAEIFSRGGIELVRASNSRVQGWMSVKELFKCCADGAPQLMVFRDCRGLINDIPSLLHSDKNPSDAATEPHEITHATDALRYYCRTRVLPGTEGEEQSGGWENGFSYEEEMTGGKLSAGYLLY